MTDLTDWNENSGELKHISFPKKIFPFEKKLFSFNCHHIFPPTSPSSQDFIPLLPPSNSLPPISSRSRPSRRRRRKDGTVCVCLLQNRRMDSVATEPQLGIHWSHDHRTTTSAGYSHNLVALENYNSKFEHSNEHIFRDKWFDLFNWVIETR